MFFFFYQIYIELKHVKEKNIELENLLLENMKITTKTKKREEALNQRVNNLEERNKELEKEIQQLVVSKEKMAQEIEVCQDSQNELFYKHNEMKIVINCIITELNNIIAVLNNQLQEI